MVAERKVSLFRNRRNQAVRIPRDMELPGEEAILRREGDRLVLEPVAPSSLLELLKGLEPIDEEFAAIDDPAPQPVKL